MPTEIKDIVLVAKREVAKAEVCPYCAGKTKFYATSTLFYSGKDYGPVWACEPCRAWVGCHKGTETPLGRLADAELRDWKKSAHSFFDPLWAAKMKKGFTKNEARNLAYKWLGKQLGTTEEYTHIGMFNVDQCKKVVEICKEYYEKSSQSKIA